jgi:hypothetical protein
MRGQDQIIQNRMDGKAPSIVFVNDYPCKTDWFEHGEQATICTHKDALRNLDMRFLVGLRVSISALSEERAKSLFERVKASGATTVAACHMQASQHATNQTGWARVWHKEAA